MVGVVDGVGERVAFAELAFVPDQIDEVEFGAHRLRRPTPAPRSMDEFDAGVDPLDVVVEMGAADHLGADVLVPQFAGRGPRRAQLKPS